MNTLSIARASLILLSFISPSSPASPPKSKSIYDFKVDRLGGGTIDFATFKGKKILVVNTASKSGFTRQYASLETLYNQYKDKVVVVAFQANNFGGQEPGSNDEIKAFCVKTYGVTFPMAAKVSAKGEDIAPVFKWLTNKTENGVMDATIQWNFTKFLLDENGVLMTTFASSVDPLREEILKYLK